MGFAKEYAQERAKWDQEFKDLQEDPREKMNYKLRSELISLRLDLDLTQQAFADLVGVQQSLISRLENGSQNVTIKTLQAILAKTGARLTIAKETNTENPDKNLVTY